MSKLGAAAKAKQRALAVATPAARAEPQQTAVSPFVRQAPRQSYYRTTRFETTDLGWPTVESVLRDARQGQTDSLADLRTRMLKSDDHLASVYETRSATIAAGRRDVKPADVPAQFERFAQLAADDCRALLESLPNIDRTLYELLDADFTGWSIAEIDWKPRGPVVWVDGIEWLHPRRFRWSPDYVPYLYDDGTAVTRAKELGLDGVARELGMVGLPLSQNKYLIHIPQVIPDVPTSGGLIVPCLRAWWLKMWARKFWLNASEVSGSPRMIGRIPVGAPDSVAAEMYSAISELSSDGVAVLREGSTLELMDAKIGATSVWETLVKHSDAAMSKAFLGSTLNVEVGDTGGNRSLGESQGDLTIWPRVTKSARSLCNTLERQLFKPFLEFNRHRYGGNVFVPRLDLVLYEDKATVDDLAVNAGVVTVDEIRQSRGLDPLGAERGGEDLVTAPDLPNVPAGMPAPTLPSAPKPDVLDTAAPVEKAADTALNGAQIDSLLTIVQNVSAGLIPRETGINLITAAFPLTPEQAEKIMGSVGAGFVPTPAGQTPAPTSPQPALVEAPAALPLRQPPWETARSLSLKSGG